MSSISSDIIDYPARDLTITVGAGMTFATLTATLAQEQQQLPIDVARDEMTIGRLVADDVCGPRMYGYGTLRDYVIGIEAIDGNGRVFHAGGRVVKNVAGYDLCRLLVGSRGELGTISQVTFKLKPSPPEQRLMAVAVPTFAVLRQALERLNTSAATPVILDVVSPDLAAIWLEPFAGERARRMDRPAIAAWLILGVEGSQIACDWQLTQLQLELADIGSGDPDAGCIGDSSAVTGWCRTAQRAAETDGSFWKARVTLLPSRVAECCEQIAQLGGVFFGRAGNGVLFVEGTSTNQAEPEVDRVLQSQIRDNSGSIQVIRGDTLRSTSSSLPVARLSNQLRHLLGAASA